MGRRRGGHRHRHPHRSGRRREARRADVEARRFIGVRASSVFPAPPAEVRDVGTYDEANALLVALGAPKLSRQAWALVPRIAEADALARTDRRVFEVHPEVSFRQLHGAPVPWSKKSWNGLHLRHRLLADAGIVIPTDAARRSRASSATTWSTPPSLPGRLAASPPALPGPSRPARTLRRTRHRHLVLRPPRPSRPTRVKGDAVDEWLIVRRNGCGTASRQRWVASGAASSVVAPAACVNGG
ncbi:MAG: DUF429 domain-containing protein [Acidimicrobiales bacterium]